MSQITDLYIKGTGAKGAASHVFVKQYTCNDQLLKARIRLTSIGIRFKLVKGES